jgi:hypothetical protein
MCDFLLFTTGHNLVPRACNPHEGMWGSGKIHCRKAGIQAKTELHFPYQQSIRFLPETDYPRASHSFLRITGLGNKIALDNVLSPCRSSVESLRGFPAGSGALETSVRRELRGRQLKFLTLTWHTVLSTNKTIGKVNFETCYIIIIVQAQSEWFFTCFAPQPYYNLKLSTVY